jgi:small GTP-binding protein
MEPLTHTAKVIVVGDSGSGKTALAQRAANLGSPCPGTHCATIGVDYFPVVVAGVRLQVWDTAGLERYACIVRSYYSNMHVAVLVYDLTRPASFARLLTQWWPEITAHVTTSWKPFVLVVGTKSDGVRDGVTPVVDPSPLLALIRTAGHRVAHVTTCATWGDTPRRAMAAIAAAITADPVLNTVCAMAPTHSLQAAPTSCCSVL